MSQGYFQNRSKTDLADLHWGLITANHILSRHGIFDAYGHVSVRNPDNPSTFFISQNMPPALVSSASELVECKVEDGISTVEDESRPEFSEKFIHSEIYRQYPGVNAVVHSHSADVLPFTTSGVPLRPTIHVAGFLGTEVPVWDIASASPSVHDLLVRDSKLGRSLAAAFSPATSAGFIMQKVRAALPESIPGAKTGSQASDPSQLPLHPVVLLRGHGFATASDGLEMAVYQAVYTAEAAKAQERAMALRAAYAQPKFEGKVDVQLSVKADQGTVSGGKIKDGQLKQEGDVHYLSDKEIVDAVKMSRNSVMRPWALWCREVEVSPTYKNTVERSRTVG